MSTDVDAIKEALKQWVDAINARRVDAVLRLVSDDVVFIHPPAVPLAGKTALARLYRAAFRAYDVQERLQYQDIRLVGALATASVTEHIQVKLKTGRAVVGFTEAEAAMRFRCQSDGAWRLVSCSLATPSPWLSPFAPLARRSPVLSTSRFVWSPSIGGAEQSRDERSDEGSRQSARATFTPRRTLYELLVHGWTTP